jgi:hypothetical protein
MLLADADWGKLLPKLEAVELLVLSVVGLIDA